MRSAPRFALAVLVALLAGDLVTWLLAPPSYVAPVRDVLLAALAFWLVRSFEGANRAAVALGGALAAEELYLLVHALLGRSEIGAKAGDPALLLVAVARGFGIFLASRGKPRWIDGLLLAVPVVVTDFLLASADSIRALGESFSVGTVAPRLLEMLAWGAAVAVLLPLAGYRRGKSSDAG